MFVIEFLIFLLEIIPLSLTLTMFFPLKKYKKLQTKEDQLFLQKLFITSIFFSIDMFFEILKAIINNIPKIFTIEIFIFNIYIISIIFYNFFLCIELYRTFTNPVHLFNRLFKQKNNNYIPEIIIIILTLMCFIFDLVSFFIFDFNNAYENDNTRLIIPNFYKFGIIAFFSLINVLICVINKSKIKKFCFKSQEKLINVFNKRIISNCLFFVYGVYYSIPLLLDTKNNETIKIFNTIGAFLILIIIISDITIHISVLAKTKFCEYCLRRHFIGYICSFFSKPQENEDTMLSLINESIANESSIGIEEGSTLNNESTINEIISNTPKDKELVSIYKNGIFLEDYFINFFDQILNILTSSIFQVYYSKFFSSNANDLRMSLEMKIDDNISEIGGGIRNESISGIMGDILADSKNQVGDSTVSFYIRKDLEKDHYSGFKQVLENGLNIENNNNYIRTDVKSFFTPKCVEIIYNQRLKGRNVGNSLLSHMILDNNKKNNDNPTSLFFSLTAANGKEEYFNKLRNTCIKTFDKNFNLDIFDCNDDELIIKKNGKNNDISILLDKYFSYIHRKGINGTFIPSLVGVFKVKINNFKTLLVFITRNSLVENIPKNFFTYWQLIRFLNDKPLKLASSQFNSGSKTLVKDDPIFERLFQVESRKDNPDFNKINIKNFSDFEETIKSDFYFLDHCGCQNFDLLLMYYEYENTQKHEKQGAIRIQKVDGDKAEIIQASLPNGMLEDVEQTPNNRFRGESIKSSMFSFGGAFFDGGEEEKGSIDLLQIKQNAANLIEYSEKFSMNGYDGVFDSFNCMCFFSFENIFDIRKRLGIKNDFYIDFKDKILINFTKYKN